MILPDFLTDDGGDINLTGHRIGLYHLIQDYNDGDCAEMLACRYPSLPLSLVHKVIAFYLENKEEVDRYIAQYSKDIDEQRRTWRPIDMDQLRQRLMMREKSTASQSPAH